MTHVALCLSDASGSYYKKTVVTALSVLANASGPVCLHLVHDETLSDAARQAFARLQERYGQEIRYHHAGEIPAATERNVPGFLGRGTLFKIMLPDLVPVDKLLYLDCDIVCTRDVSAVFAHDVTGYCLGAVKMGEKQSLAHSRRLGMRSKICINAGVLLMNLAKIRRDIPDYAQQMFAIGSAAKIRLGDQGATNIFFDGRPDAFAFLPEDCNFRIEHGDRAVLPMSAYQGKVIHFAGKKPWNVLTTPGLYYWKYYAKAFPGEDVFGLMETLEPYEYNRLFAFVLRRESIRRWVNRLDEIAETGIVAALRKRLGAPSRAE